jgi:hypothetical protein
MWKCWLLPEAEVVAMAAGVLPEEEAAAES